MNSKFLSVLTALVIGLPMLASAVTQQQTPASAPACPAFGTTLKRGSSGADVARLQQFLAQDKTVYPEGTITGTYGPLTEKAVQRFQAKNGIASSGTPETTGYGAVGPRTAAAMSAGCPGAAGAPSAPSTSGMPNAVGGVIAIAPYASGSSRSISVQVTANTTNSCNAATYFLDYGDGTGKSPVAVPAGACRPMTSTVNHTYQLAGTYQVTLSVGAAHAVSVAVAVK